MEKKGWVCMRTHSNGHYNSEKRLVPFGARVSKVKSTNSPWTAELSIKIGKNFSQKLNSLLQQK